MPARNAIVLTAGFLLNLLAADALAQSTGPAQTRPTTTDDAATLLALGKRDLRVHDPSTIVRCKDQYWLFATGRGVSSYHSKDLVNWEPGPPVFNVRPPWTLQAVPGHRGGDQGHYWAPDVTFANGQYLLYYSVSTFGRNTSAIGLATNPTLDPADPSFRWTDQGIVIQSAASDKFNAIDPAAFLDADGSLWLTFGSFWSGIKLIQLDPRTGTRIAPDSPLHSLAHNQSIEAPFITRHGEHYFLLVNWGTCCRGVLSTYNIRVGRSTKITGPYLDREGKDLLAGGGTLLLQTQGPMIGPGHPAVFEKDNQSWLSFHFYDPTRRGAGTLAIRKLSWTPEGWPGVGSELSK
jgi:arabinan endo-1,5-alpha-L-arabinosidase